MGIAAARREVGNIAPILDDGWIADEPTIHLPQSRVNRQWDKEAGRG